MSKHIRGWARWFAMGGIIAAIFLPAHAGANEAKPWRIYFVDVGYADAIFMEFPDGTTMLIDSGDAKHASHLTAFLKANRVRNIHTAVITHPHQNHFGGFRKIAGRMAVGRLFHNGDPNTEEGYAALMSYLQRKQIPIAILKRGQKLEHPFGAVTVEVLNPPDLQGNPNDNAIVLWMKHGKVSVLFLSDIGAPRQKDLLETFPAIRQAECVQVPHHGGPLSEAFIEAFRGKTLIVSTGPNRWGLPQAEELQRLEGNIYRTDRDGTIMVESDGNSLKVLPWTATDY